MVRIERFIDQTLAAQTNPEQRKVLHRYTVWHLTRRLRQRNNGHAATIEQFNSVRQRTYAAIAFLDWLTQHQLTLGSCRQSDLDRWLTDVTATHRANVAMAQALTPRLLEQSPDAILVFVANPVDVVTYAAASVIQAAPGRIFGSGTILDSSRFRYLIAQRAGLAVGNVHGVIVGNTATPKYRCGQRFLSAVSRPTAFTRPARWCSMCQPAM